LRVALFQPDIAANTGAAIRLCACLGVPLSIIEPSGFVWDERRLRRVGLTISRRLPLPGLRPGRPSRRRATSPASGWCS
jgi:tRNA (cytidine/uridine-2'-O-)-methyltransferase